MTDQYRCGRCGAPRHRIRMGPTLDDPSESYVPGECVRGCDSPAVRYGWAEPPPLAYPTMGALARWGDA